MPAGKKKCSPVRRTTGNAFYVVRNKKGGNVLPSKTTGTKTIFSDPEGPPGIWCVRVSSGKAFWNFESLEAVRGTTEFQFGRTAFLDYEIFAVAAWFDEELLEVQEPSTTHHNRQPVTKIPGY